MRAGLDKSKLYAFLDAIGRGAQSPGRVYLVGGATALLLGIRDQTIDVDIKLDPEPKGVFESIALLKEKLDLNVELAAPDDFMPALPGWRERSEYIATNGPVDFYHYDFYGQALAKILRGHCNDTSDAIALVRLGKVLPDKLQELFGQIKSDLIRFPAIDIRLLTTRVENFTEEASSESG